jgi:3-oxoacyl-[acyl-carrier protein] reductase
MKFALVTGGSRGIGRAISLKLAGNGYNILLNYASNSEAAEKTKTDIETQFGVKVELLPFNVSDLADVENNLGKWIEANPDKKIEVLVNNAGIRKDALMVFMKDEDWSDVLNISLNGFFNVTRAVLKNMIVGRSGRIVNVVSLSGLKGMPGQTNYSAAKAAVIGATKALAQEVGKRGVRVNAVAPGFIVTDMTADINEADYKAMVPLNRFGKAEEVANVVAFLAGDESSYITGEVISVNGGMYS